MSALRVSELAPLLRPLTEKQREMVCCFVRLWELGATTEWYRVRELGVEHLFERADWYACPTPAARAIAARQDPALSVGPPRALPKAVGEQRAAVVAAVDHQHSAGMLAAALGVPTKLAADLIAEEAAIRAGEPSPAAISRFFAESRD